MSFVEHLAAVKALHLPLGTFAIFGSGPLAVRGIREAEDVDLIVIEDVWDELAKVHPPEGNVIRIGAVEIYRDWGSDLGWGYTANDVRDLIETAEMIDGFPFVRLFHVVEWKKKRNSEKDKRDLDLIDCYLAE